MEISPPNRYEATTPDKPEDKKTKRKKRTGSHVLNAHLTSEPKKLINPKESKPIDATLAELLLKKKQDKEEVAEPEEPVATEKTEVVLTEEVTHELRPDQLYVGEGILQLDEAEVEHEIPLRTPETETPRSYERWFDEIVLPRNEPEEAATLAPTYESVANYTELSSMDSQETKPPVTAHEVEQPIPIVQPEITPVERAERVEQGWAQTSPVAIEQPATKKEVDDALHAVEKAGQNRGLLTGLMVGGGYEHLKHKHREKRQSRVFEHQEKRSKSQEISQNELWHEFDKERQTTQVELNRLDKRFEQNRFENKPEKKPEAPLPEAPEQPELPADRRVETSAWHRIELDVKTGKPVDKPTLEYGREYYRERQQETAPLDTDTTAAAGEIALVAAALGKSSPQSALPNIPSAATQKPVGPTVLVRPGLNKVAPAGPLWPYVVTLIIVVIALIFALR
ncbi:MAG: hypothetical protein WC498_04185 [Candidatus Saccharimonadales bacterium]